jgi:hypothetical protein
MSALALASSGTGKEFPRKVNSQVLFQIGMAASLGDKFASGEGIQDSLVRTGRMLFQNDEMDGVLRQINLDRENSRESIPNILLTLYTSAGDVYPVRVKANQKEPIHIDQPHLTLFGTATPQYFYEALSKRMLTMPRINPSPIRHPMSPPVTFLSPKQADLAPKSSNPSPCVTRCGDGLVTDLQRRKVHTYRGKTLFSMYLSPCHAHTRAMCVCTRKGAVGRISGDGSLCDTLLAQILNRGQIFLG